MSVLEVKKDYSSLSLKDLLEAREMYHLHLIHKKNVIATAIGKYLIREGDPWPHEKREPQKPKSKRTLENAQVRSYSWPCILVFVEKWEKEADLIDSNYGDIVPKALFMPDGRVIPVCIVEAQKREFVTKSINESEVVFPSNFAGPGFPLITFEQEQERIASTGCLVTDGNLVYALTNKHVAGKPGNLIFTKLGNEIIKVGVTSEKQISKLPFSEVYNEWPGNKILLNMDVCLVELFDLNEWKTDIFNIGDIGMLADLSTYNFSLNLINEKVISNGAVSGLSEGRILGLFYRYKSVGGFEYVSDFIIGPKEGEKYLNIQKGDSGTLWLLKSNEEDKKPPRALALQWGQHTFVDRNNEETQPYALATCLSSICHLLEVDIVRDWNLDWNYTWGKVAHYAHGTYGINAIDAKLYPKLKELMNNNSDILSVGPASINKSLDRKHFENFVPLADVPDLVWKYCKSPGWRKNLDKAGHYANIDLELEDGTTLLEHIMNNGNKVSDLSVWIDFYEKAKINKGKDRGLLPFRVGQIFTQMVKALKAGNKEKFICSAGILSHYVGDACIPLHCSILHHGYSKKEINGKPGGYKVHSDYENRMVIDHIHIIKNKLPEMLERENGQKPINSGVDAIVAAYDLMYRTMEEIPPKELVDKYIEYRVEAKEMKARAKNTYVSNKLWENFGEKTMKNLANGCILLARLWESAWRLGNGEVNIQNTGDRVSEADMIKLYCDNSFLESKYLAKYNLSDFKI